MSDQKQKTVNDVFFHEDPEINSSLRKIYNQDENFSSKRRFLDGSKKSFRIYNKKLLEENLNPLKSLLSKSIFNDFKSQIDERVKKSQNLDITIIGLKL